MNKENLTAENAKIADLMQSYLCSRAFEQTLDERHIDEDALTAFVEGNLKQRESAPIVGHLVNCSFCRNVTAELVRLDLAFAAEDAPRTAATFENQPSKISEVIGNLFSRIFGTNDDAVFAHEEKKEDADESDESIEK